MVNIIDTIVAIATPRGRGGLGIVRISGPCSMHVARQISKPANDPVPRQAHYLKIHDKQGNLIDRGLLIYFPTPESFTGEDVIEIYAHGSQVVLQQIVEHAVTAGCRLAKPGEFTEQAFLNNKIDLVQAEATADLIEAVSSQAARSALRSLEGEFSATINELLQQIIRTRTQIEASLDFPEEDTDFGDNSVAGSQIEKLHKQLHEVLDRAHSGALLKDGITLVIAGEPNVGKSTLLNCLVKNEAAIVSDIPGTTRDQVERDILVDGVIVRLVDTAGLRETSDMIEQEGIKRTHAVMKTADIIVYVREYDQHPADSEISNLQKEYRSRVIIVENKIDKHDIAPAVSESENGLTCIIRLSAKNSVGLDLLIGQIKKMTGLQNLNEDVFMARKRHVYALQKTQLFIENASRLILDRKPVEMLAEELRLAQEALSEITGKYAADDLLGNIFSTFCIGK